MLDDEDDEPTLSTDNYDVTTFEDESQKAIPISTSTFVTVELERLKTEAVSNDKNIENIKPNEGDPQTEGVSRIQKQISLYERDNSSEFKKFSHDVEKLTRRDNVAKRWISATQQTNYVSADNLSNTSFYIGRNPTKNSKPDSHNPKTMSCMNLKSCAGSSITPGAVLVKEKFIEPPLRVAKSFHGNTSFLKYKCKKSKKMDAGVSTDSVFNVPTTSCDIKHRFVTTKVNECKIDSTDSNKVAHDEVKCVDKS